MLKSLHVRLLVADFPACFRFYRDTLGFTVNFGTEDDVYGEFSNQDFTLALFQRALMAEAVHAAAKPAFAEAQDRVALVFSTDNVDSTARQLQERGAILVAEPQNRPEWMIRTAHLRDPDGNLLEIYSDLPA